MIIRRGKKKKKAKFLKVSFRPNKNVSWTMIALSNGYINKRLITFVD